MAVLDLPDGTLVTNVNLLFTSPGQTSLTYPYSGVEDIISRGPTVVYGTLTTFTKKGTERNLLAFAQALNGRAGMFRFPLRPVKSYGPQAHASNASDLQDYRVVSVGTDDTIEFAAEAGSGTVDWEPRLNDWINIAHRLVRVSDVTSNTRIKTSPVVARAGDTIRVGEPYVIARLDSQSAVSLSTSRTGNDIQTIGWVEVVGAPDA